MNKITITTYARLIDFATKSLKFHEPDKPNHTRTQVEEHARWIAAYVETQRLIEMCSGKDLAEIAFCGDMPNLSGHENLLVWCHEFDATWVDDPEDAQTLEDVLATYWPSYEHILEQA